MVVATLSQDMRSTPQNLWNFYMYAHSLFYERSVHFHCLMSQQSHSQLTVLVAQFLGIAAVVHHVVHIVRQYDCHLHLPSR